MATWSLESFQGQKLDDPGMKIPTTPTAQNPRDSVSSVEGTSSPDSTVSLRIYCGDAIVSPGSLYKSVIANATTTANEVIKKTLERYEDNSDPSGFELRYVRFNEKTGKIRRESGSLTSVLQKNSDKDHVLAADECPVLVAEWFTEAPRKFMIFRRKSETEPALKKQGSFMSRAIKSFRRKSEQESTHVYNIHSPDKNTSFTSQQEEEEEGEEDESHHHNQSQHRLSHQQEQQQQQYSASSTLSPTAPATTFSPARIQRDSAPQVDLTRRPSAKFEASL